ncbi:MAG: hypothetical protein ACREEB_19065 [Caulobacteraceae bacterium]
MRATIFLAVLACGASGLGACSRTAAKAAGPGAAAQVENPCDRKLISQADMAGILGEPITSVAPLPGDAQSCVFRTASFTSITVSLRPGVGRATVETWASGKMPLTASPLAGVGERAVWQSTLHEVIAEKDNVLCDIGVIGPPTATTGATPTSVGALCRKIFAAL